MKTLHRRATTNGKHVNRLDGRATEIAGKNWKRDFVMESKLQRLDIDFVYVELPLIDLALTASLEQSGRIEALDDSKVTEYGLSMLNDEPFPAIVVQVLGGKHIIICGNHRAHAAKEAGLQYVGCYVIACNDSTKVSMLSVSDNTSHGLALKTEEKCLLALKWVEQFKFSRKDVGKLLHLDDSTLSQYMLSRKVRDIASKANIRTNKLTVAQAVAVHPLVDVNQRVGVELVRFVVKHNLASDKIRVIAKSVRDGVDEADMIAKLAVECQKMERIIRPKTRTLRAPNRTAFLDACSRMQRILLRCPTLDAAQITDSTEFENTRAVLKDIRRMIGSVLNG